MSYPAPYRLPSPAPSVGQTRCYWALLSADLRFLHLDPVLATQLADQAALLVGQSLVRFIHPDEQASAKHDLGSVLKSKNVHGSVTHARFARLSKVRRDLGYNGPASQWSDTDRVAFDKDYMIVDIVTNWAAEDLVLCFIHAITDLSEQDNDEQHKTAWTNWCGTPPMNDDQIAQLYKRLLISIPRPMSVSRVFQMLANKPGRPLLISWPPDQPGPGPTGLAFAKLVEHVQLVVPDVNDAKTSCTRRFQATQPIPSDYASDKVNVESIFIQHGAIMFACHKVVPPSRIPGNPSATMQQPSYSAGYSIAQNSSYYDQAQSAYALPPLQTSTYNYISQQPSPVESQYPPIGRWPQGPGEAPNAYNSQWNSQTPPRPTASLTPNRLRSTYPPPLPSQPWTAPPTSAYNDGAHGQPQSYQRSTSPNYAYSIHSRGDTGGTPADDTVPLPRRRVSSGSGRDQYGSNARGGNNRPSGVLKCSSCKATQSPEWRKGPSGKKELCNACGLRYARSRAKKEGGNQNQRKRKDKSLLAKHDSATPQTASSSTFSAIRRSYEDGSFSSAGSGSGSDIYSRSAQQHVLGNMTPSPSPPASTSSVNFVHYSPGGETRHSYSSNNNYFTVPSPLSTTHVIHPQEPQHVHQLPPLISSFPPRLSALVPSVSPQSSSTGTGPPASYERERDKEREMPLTPLSAEPRNVRRSILSHQ